MKKKKPLIALGVAALMAVPLLLVGCSQDVGDTAHADHGLYPGSLATGYVALPDGRTVLCVGYATKGISCDWDNAK